MNLQQGVSALLQVAGVGKMKPNILLLGYKNDWQVCEDHSLDHYFAAIQSVTLPQFCNCIFHRFNMLNSTGFDLQVAVAILRTPEGLDCTAILTDLEDRDYILNTLGSLNRSSSTSKRKLFHSNHFDFFLIHNFVNMSWTASTISMDSVPGSPAVEHRESVSSLAERDERKTRKQSKLDPPILTYEIIWFRIKEWLSNNSWYFYW